MITNPFTKKKSAAPAELRLSDVLATFNKAINDCVALVKQNQTKVAANDNVINTLRNRNNELSAEAAKAESVRLKLVDLTS